MTRPEAIQYFSSHADIYAEKNRDGLSRASRVYQGLLDHLKIKVPLGKLLDVGIASASLSLPFHEKGFEVYGLDGSEEMLELAEAAGIPKDYLTHLDLLENPIPFEDDFFDIVITGSTLFYLNNACQVVEEMIAATKPGGILLLDIDLHDALPEGCFVSDNLSDDRPLLYIQSEHVLQDIFTKMSVEVLGRHVDTAQAKHDPELGAFQITSNIFALRKN